MQSYKYFDKFEDMIRATFTFKKSIIDATISFFLQTAETHPKLSKSIWIGIHNRRTDYISNHSIQYGRVVPDAQYFKHTMAYFKNRIQRPITFIVCGDDPNWNTEHIASLHINDVIISRGQSASVDLAILAACDHVIMSVGSFGWWGAYLAEGTVVYYSEFARPGSNKEAHFIKDDHYPPHWISMT